MSVSDAIAGLHHPAWRTAGATVAGYLLLLAVVFLGLFVVPWLVVSAV